MSMWKKENIGELWGAVVAIIGKCNVSCRGVMKSIDLFVEVNVKATCDGCTVDFKDFCPLDNQFRGQGLEFTYTVQVSRKMLEFLLH